MTPKTLKILVLAPGSRTSSCAMRETLGAGGYDYVIMPYRSGHGARPCMAYVWSLAPLSNQLEEHESPSAATLTGAEAAARRFIQRKLEPRPR